MLDPAKFFQYHFGPEFRMDQAQGRLVSQCLARHIHIVQEFLPAPEYFGAPRRYLRELEDLLRDNTIKMLLRSIPLDRTLSDRKDVSQLAH